MAQRAAAIPVGKRMTREALTAKLEGANAIKELTPLLYPEGDDA